MQNLCFDDGHFVRLHSYCILFTSGGWPLAQNQPISDTAPVGQANAIITRRWPGGRLWWFRSLLRIVTRCNGVWLVHSHQDLFSPHSLLSFFCSCCCLFHSFNYFRTLIKEMFIGFDEEEKKTWKLQKYFKLSFIVFLANIHKWNI